MGVGLPAGVIQEPDGDGFDVWCVNWDSVKAFLACETQWRVAASMAGLLWLGLDYAAVAVVLDRMRSPEPVFNDLRLMETAALSVLNARPE